jgi:hypothetical protein
MSQSPKEVVLTYDGKLYTVNINPQRRYGKTERKKERKKERIHKREKIIHFFYLVNFLNE